MKTSSAKAKGRRLQQKVAKRLQEWFGFVAADCRSIPMGAQGCDIWLSSSAQEKFPFAMECKNVEKINIWEAWKQAKTHALNGREIEEVYPLIVFSKNNEEVLVTLRLDDLLSWGLK